ncbi:MerR family transcriptional regulator [Actinoplanes sp. NPDC026623]|uniref:DNA polymerase III subunit beta family protein n=1 Tax=Actinoplanes sp. NPDC026623 TaxID=3155610 RepID=UPI0033DFE3D9
MHGIGEIARASGLSISALRFYDGAGVLVPAEVDPVNGYRRYSDDQVRAARLVAGLRRIGMPVPEITRAVSELANPPAVRRLLGEHLRRLEDGLADARRELSRVHALLDLQEITMTRITLPAAALAAVLDAVRFAASADPDLPILGGVLLETEPAALRTVATDRFRLAVAETAAGISGPPARVVAPLSFVDELRALLIGDGQVVLALSPEVIGAEVAGLRLDAKPMEVEFPDHRRLVDPDAVGAQRVTVDVTALRAAVDAAPAVSREHEGKPFDLTILAVDPAGALRVAREQEWAADEQAHVAVNREFLLQALDAGGAGQLVLELDGPIKPLAVRGAGSFSILMPVRR